MPEVALKILLLWDMNCALYVAFFGLGMLWNELDFIERARRLAVICWQAGFKVGTSIAPKRDDWWRFKRRKKS